MRKKIINAILLLATFSLLLTLIINAPKRSASISALDQEGTYGVTLLSPNKLTLLDGKFSLANCEESYQFYNIISTNEEAELNKKAQSINLSTGEKLAPTTALFGDFSSLFYKNNGICNFYLRFINEQEDNPLSGYDVKKNNNEYLVTSPQGVILRISFLY